jgi:uncharacterized damage-inducible protein DinB
MKEVLAAMAAYNAKAFDAVLDILAAIPSPLRSKDTGAYFKSIDGITEHMAWAQALWLQRFAAFGSYACLEQSPLVAKPLDELKAELKGDSGRLSALLRDTSGLLARFIGELPEAEFDRRVRYRTTDGNELERTFWHAIMQVLNHGTHHRGELSAILDMNGVKNDFNSFVSYMP